jgi:hypothetical protein
MSDYSVDFIARVIKHSELIDSFIERTTSDLFSVGYEIRSSDEFYSQEGNTLRNPAPQGTRVPNRDSLKENCIIWRADIDRALDQLSWEERFCVIYFFRLHERGVTKSKETAVAAIEKMARFLNDGLLAA